jgi:hypothetical protein
MSTQVNQKELSDAISSDLPQRCFNTKIDGDLLNTPLECYKTGTLGIFPIEDAAKELSQANYGMVIHWDRYFWSIGGIVGESNMYQHAGEKGLLLGFYVHTNLQQPFTLHDAEVLIKTREKILEQDLFITWASRFNSIFEHPIFGKKLPRDLRPFYHLKIADRHNRTLMPAYQMHPGRSSFVIFRPDIDNSQKTVPREWSLVLYKLYLKYKQKQV